MFNSLLVPLDGSPQSAHVIELASRMATPGTAVVHLLCVVDPSYLLPHDDENGVTPDGMTYPFAEAQTSFARSVLTTAAAQLAGRNLTVEQHLCPGNPPANVVIEQAELLSAEIIVMGHHHLSRLGRWANPSTSGEVIDRSPCLVLVETRDRGRPRDPVKG
jgi:nucleotide-binding universal stress UspA family protein